MREISSTTKKIFILSLVLNLIFSMLFGYAVYKKGGMSYLIKKTKSFTSAKKIKPKLPAKKVLTHSTFYYDRKSHFESLYDTDHEIIFLGDSITHHCEWVELFQNHRIKNRGIGGDSTDGVLLRLDEIVSSLPDKIFIMIGINELGQGIKVTDIAANYEKIVRYLLNKSPDTQIYLQSVLPINDKLYNFFYKKAKATNDNIIKLNKHLKNLASELGVQYIELSSFFIDDKNQLDKQFSSDGLHLNGKAYLVWKNAIEQYVNN